MTSQPSVHLISVNKTPARAATLVAQMIDSLQPEYHIVHVANASTIDGLKTIIESLVVPPALIICSSQWTSEEQTQADNIATKVVPTIKIINIPPGLDSREGGEAIVKFLLNAVRASGISSRMS